MACAASAPEPSRSAKEMARTRCMGSPFGSGMKVNWRAACTYKIRRLYSAIKAIAHVFRAPAGAARPWRAGRPGHRRSGSTRIRVSLLQRRDPGLGGSREVGAKKSRKGACVLISNPTGDLLHTSPFKQHFDRPDQTYLPPPRLEIGSHLAEKYPLERPNTNARGGAHRLQRQVQSRIRLHGERHPNRARIPGQD